MADDVTGGSPEAIALVLFRIVAASEGKSLNLTLGKPENMPDRKWLLDTYAECLSAVKGDRATPIEIKRTIVDHTRKNEA